MTQSSDGNTERGNLLNDATQTPPQWPCLKALGAKLAMMDRMSRNRTSAISSSTAEIMTILRQRVTRSAGMAPSPLACTFLREQQILTIQAHTYEPCSVHACAGNHLLSFPQP